MPSYKQGFYKPVHPEKYVGDPNKIVYRSSWELRYAKWCDSRENVISWSSEECVVPYFSPLDQKMHRYFVDFMVTLKLQDGTTKTLLVEIKPHAEVMKPAMPKKQTRKSMSRYNAAVETWIRNQTKWEAAREYAKQRGWEFIVLTEKQLFPSQGKR